MRDYSYLYFYYQSILVKFLRIFIILLFLGLSIISFFNKTGSNIFLFFLSVFLIWEVYFNYKIARLEPIDDVSQSLTEPIDAISLVAMSIFQTQGSSSSFIKTLSKLPQVKFIFYRIDLTEKEVQRVDIDKKQIAQKALELVKNLNAKNITSMDLFVAYLILSEPTTKVLFNKKIKNEDILNILRWARHTFPEEENPNKVDFKFSGEGVAESWIYGWTIETQKYMLDVSSEFVNDNDLSFEREKEYGQMLESLYKGTSVILVGDAGAGKESAVKQLSIQSYNGKLTGNLMHQKVFQLMVDALMAGAQNQGELEARIDAIIAEVAHSGNVIVYIPEFQNILGSDTFKLDISGAIIPYLQKGKIRIIAAVSPGAYKKFIEPKHSLLEAFTVINFSEPPETEVLEMLFKKTKHIENKNNVEITYKAILAAARFADKYAKERVLPGSAVVLLEDTANVVKIKGKKMVEEQDVLDQVEKKINVAVGEPTKQEKGLLLNLEKEMHKRIIDQEEAVTAIAEAIRRLRTGLAESKKPISFLFLGPTGVGKTETAKALAQVYFGNGTRLVRLDMSEFEGEEGMKRLLGSAPGEGDEKGQLTEPVYDSPYSLVLLDEFEKADPKILDLFLQVLDDGRLTDNKGKTVSFVNTIIIATSNAASEFIREEVEKGTHLDKKFQESLLNYLQSHGILRPELLNRFDAVITFKPLGAAELTQIIKIILTEVAKTLTEKDINVSFDEKVIAKIGNEGSDKQFGARPLRRYIQDNIEDLIAQKMLRDEIKRGDKLVISVDNQNAISINKV